MNRDADEILPPKEKRLPVEKSVTSVRLPLDLAAELDAAVEETGHSRSAAIVHLLRWALKERKARQKPKK